MNEIEIRRYIEDNLNNGFTLYQIQNSMKQFASEDEFMHIIDEYRDTNVKRDAANIAVGKKIGLLIILGFQSFWTFIASIILMLGPDNSFVELLGYDILGDYIYGLAILSMIQFFFQIWIISHIAKDHQVGYSMSYLQAIVTLVLNVFNILQILINGAIIFLSYSCRKEKFNQTNLQFSGDENRPLVILTIWMVSQAIIFIAGFALILTNLLQ